MKSLRLSILHSGRSYTLRGDLEGAELCPNRLELTDVVRCSDALNPVKPANPENAFGPSEF
jgi:hypothetical protein